MSNVYDFDPEDPDPFDDPDLIDEDFDNLSEAEDEYSQTFLEFYEDIDLDTSELEDRVSSVLEEYSFEEILEENEMDEEKAATILYELGYIGLPTELVEEDDSEEMQDIQEED